MSTRPRSMWGVNSKGSPSKAKEKADLKSGSGCCGSRFKDFCDNTSLDGPKYITQEGTSWPVALLWLLVVLAAICLGIYLVYRIIFKWQTSPIITSIDTPSYDVTNIEFPAVTICPFTLFIKEKIINQVCKRGYLSEAIKRGLTLADELKYAMNTFFGLSNGDSSNVSAHLKINDSDVISTFLKSVPSCDIYVLYCNWNGNDALCNTIFTLVATDMGYCCSFNIVPPKEALTDIGTGHGSSNGSPLGTINDSGLDPNSIPIPSMCPASPLESENNTLWQIVCSDLANSTVSGNSATTTTTTASTMAGSGKTVSKNNGIKKVRGAGVLNGLTVLVDTLQCGFISIQNIKAFKVLVHNSNSFPTVAQRGFVIAPGLEAFVDIDATVTESTAATTKYGNVTRGCNMDNERPLTIFKTYSKDNCEMEAVILTTVNKCGCKPFLLPGNFRTCGTADRNCSTNIAYSTPNCLPSCSEVTYDVSVTSGPFNDIRSISYKYGVRALQTKDNKYLENNIAVMHFFFGDSFVVKYKRDELYGVEDVIANIGGSLGLCMGFSLVSGFEIIFFFGLRYIIERIQRR